MSDIFGILDSITRRLHAYHDPSSLAIRRAHRVLKYTRDTVRLAHIRGGVIDTEALEYMVKWAVTTVDKATDPHRRKTGGWGAAVHAELLAEVEKEGKCNGVQEGEVEGSGAYSPLSVPSHTEPSIASQVASKPLQIADLGTTSTSSEASNNNVRFEMDIEGGFLPREIWELLGEEAVKGFHEEMYKWEAEI